MTYRLRGLVGATFGLLAVGGSAWGQLAYPEGTQDMESLAVGQSVMALPDFGALVNTSANQGDFTVVGANDVNGNVGARGTSTRWIRITDVDAANVQNRLYFVELDAVVDEEYDWEYWVNLENTPPGGANTKPKITIQHRDNANVFANAWGIEFADTGASLIVLGIGGTAASVQLYPLSGATGVGQWVKINLRVRFGENLVYARANDGPEVSLPINLSGNKQQFRWCYRGEGSGNMMRILVDDISVNVIGPPPVPTLTGAGVGVMGVMVLAAAIVVVKRWRRQNGPALA